MPVGAHGRQAGGAAAIQSIDPRCRRVPVEECGDQRFSALGSMGHHFDVCTGECEPEGEERAALLLSHDGLRDCRGPVRRQPRRAPAVGQPLDLSAAE